ncbi:putative F-box protein At5g55150 [Papaver somniferum]|uniref:putative F-box protein At5g55150 n=1 Tax=Papaver somniferum TaxID=3469 RepID=UPI000E6FA56C|nr:putative F-box protein At5g55150 [Papaver somniferum]
MDVNWSELQPELVQLIANKLTSYIDYIRFRSVCVNWHSTLSPTHRYLPYQFPWLMLPYTGNCCRFFNLSANKVYQLNLPLPKAPVPSRCCGSSHGWLVFQVENNPSIFLFNPLTSIQIQLPPLTAFPNVLDFDVNKVGKEYLFRDSPTNDPYRCSAVDILDSFIKKVVFSSSPTSDEYIVLVIMNETGQLVYCKKGFESWKMIDGAQGYSQDVIFYKGLFYAVTKRGAIAICDVTGESPVVTIITTPPLRRPLPSRTILVDYDRYYSDELLYLVDVLGELLLVARYFELVVDTEPNMSVYKTVGFFKLISPVIFDLNCFIP